MGEEIFEGKTEKRSQNAIKSINGNGGPRVDVCDSFLPTVQSKKSEA